MGIQRDLALGKQAELKTILLLEEAGITASFQTKKGKFTDYDLEASMFMSNGDLVSFTLEVKYDIYSLKSGNIAIEIYNPKSGKKSGLSATKSNLWAHITDKCYIAHTPTLKEWVEKTTPKRFISSGGDNNASLNLYDVDTIFNEPLFYNIDSKTPTERKEIIEKLLSI